MDTHRDLPGITWMIAPRGCSLIGRMNGHESDQVRAAFGRWCRAINVDVVPSETHLPGRGAYLRAAGRARGVEVVLTATILGDDEGPGLR